MVFVVLSWGLVKLLRDLKVQSSDAAEVAKCLTSLFSIYPWRYPAVRCRYSIHSGGNVVINPVSAL